MEPKTLYFLCLDKTIRFPEDLLKKLPKQIKYDLNFHLPSDLIKKMNKNILTEELEKQMQLWKNKKYEFFNFYYCLYWIYHLNINNNYLFNLILDFDSIKPQNNICYYYLRFYLKTLEIDKNTPFTKDIFLYCISKLKNGLGIQNTINLF